VAVGAILSQRKIDIFRDKNWVGPLDIFAWLIEHPEGGYR
jgi:N-acyl homoserine lactone hydrolase